MIPNNIFPRKSIIENNLSVCPHSNPPISSFSEDALELKNKINQLGQLLFDETVYNRDYCSGIRFFEERLAKAMIQYNKKNCNHHSDLDGYGNKHKNLIKQHNLVEALGLSGVSVPKPRGLNSAQIHQFLCQYGSEIFTIWQELGKLYEAHASRHSFFEDQEIKEHIAKIETIIETAFYLAADNEELFQTLGSHEICLWLEEVLKGGNYLMVRSTGSEDSKQMANAGGNVSVAYVKPTRIEFCRALGAVVCSYFNPRSLQNRIDCGNNPFQEGLKLAVTAQELIGEEVGGSTNTKNIPKSAVLFTNEPLYVGSEKFRVMRLSGTYGHGEAVVENLGISSDTVLLLHSESDPDKLFILYDNQVKKMRLAPIYDHDTGKISLQKIANDPSIVNERVFDDQMLMKIYQWGVIGEKFFEDDATDMELVIKGDTIYAVQARPVVRSSQLPTYLDLKKVQERESSPIEKVLNTTLQVSGNASVTTIEHSDHILTASSLKEVEGKRLFKRGQHRIVVIAMEEPANSHPVVNFSGYGIPCLYAHEGLNPVKSLVKQIDSNHQLAVCVQSGTINLWNTSLAAIVDYSSKGYVVHPAKIAHSFSSTFLASKPGAKTEIAQELKDLLFQLTTETSHKIALQCLEGIQNHDWLKKFAERQQGLIKQMEEVPLSKRVISPVVQVSEELICKINNTFQQLSTILRQPDKRLHPLLFAKVLDTLLFSHGKDSGAVGQCSFVTMGAHFAAGEEQIAYQRELSHPAHFINELMFGFEGPIPAVFTDWRAFLLQLESLVHENTQAVAQFKDMLCSLKELGAMPWFITLTLGDSKHLPPLARMKHLVTLLLESQKPLLNGLIERKTELKMQLQQIDGFAEPEKFKKAFENLKKETEKFFPGEQGGTLLKQVLMGHRWEQTSPLVKVMVIETMNALVDLYDTAIKTMKSSSNFSDQEKTKIFKEMLYPYFSLLKFWVQETLGSNSFPMHNGWTQKSYLDVIFGRLDNRAVNDPAQLDPSIGFSVSAAALGSATEFMRHYPNTLEDVFTLIHQNLLATTAKLLNPLLSNEQIEKSQMPLQLKRAISCVPSIEANNVGAPQRIGVEVTEDQIIIHYNVPLRNHSSRFALCYSSEEGSAHTVMKSQFLGEARERWSTSAEVTKFFNELLGFADSTPEVAPNEFIYSLKLENDETIAISLALYKMIAQYSMEPVNLQEWLANYLIQLNLLEEATQIIFKMDKIPTYAGEICFRKLLEIWENRTEQDEVKMPIYLKGNDLKISPLSKAFGNELVMAQSSDGKIILKPNTNLKLKLYQKIIIKEKEYDRVFECIKQGLMDPNIGTNLLALNIFIELVDKLGLTKERFTLSEIENIAKKWWSSPEEYVKYRMVCCPLYNVLVKNGCAYEQAIGAVCRSFEYALPDFDLVESLFEKEKGFEALEKVAADALLAKGNTRPSHAKALYEKLFIKGKGYPSAADAAKKAFSADNFESREVALWIFCQLFARDLGYKEAIEAACCGWLKDDIQIRSSVLRIFDQLFLKNLGFEAAKEAAKEAALSKDFMTRIQGMMLYKKLVQCGKGCSEALEVVINALYKGNGYSGHEYGVLRILLRNGEGIDQIEKAASQAALSEDVEIRRNALMVYEALLDVEKAVEGAERAIEEALQGGDNRMKSKAKELCREYFRTKIESKSQLIKKYANKASNSFAEW